MNYLIAGIFFSLKAKHEGRKEIRKNVRKRGRERESGASAFPLSSNNSGFLFS